MLFSALTSKRTEEVANILLPIFLTFGAPAILQSDNGREFVNGVISELSTLWPELKLVTGRPRHPQSQGAVERLYGVIQDKLKIWMKENKSSQWSIGLKFVQWQINISRHETVKNSPFKIMFGEEPMIGLASTVVPPSMHEKIQSEEDLDEVMGSAPEEGGEKDEETVGEVPVEATNIERHVNTRQAASEGQENTAQRMTRRAKQLLKELEAGTKATVQVPAVDRGPTDARNLLVVVIEKDGQLYRVGCKEGIISNRYTAAD